MVMVIAMAMQVLGLIQVLIQVWHLPIPMPMPMSMQLLASIINKRGSGSGGMNDSIFEMDGVPLCPGHNEPYPTLTSKAS